MTSQSESVSENEATEEQIALASENYRVGTMVLDKIVGAYQSFRSSMPPDINPMAMPPELADVLMGMGEDELRLIVTVSLSNFWEAALMLAKMGERISQLEKELEATG